ncbi:MAG: heat-inducible transcriptional repressor HrcA [Candidatus Omnitrophota bacterium]
MINRKEERKFQVLGHIIHLYVSTAIPVSSKTVAFRMGGAVSSATIRNIMAELEEQGYIMQPHTSAGRVPTHFGYRRYVDSIQAEIIQRREEAERLREEYRRRISTIKEVIETTSYLISRELHNAGIVMWPNIENFYLKHMELIKLKAETILAVLVSMTNAVKNCIVRLDHEIGKAELEQVANFINTNYERAPFSDISGELRKITNGPGSEHYGEAVKIAGTALKIIDSVISENIENEIYWQGLDYFVNEPEFQDLELTRKILHIFSDRSELARLLRTELPYDGIKIYIGRENSCEVLKECTLITCGYRLKGATIGRIGVVGPTRMDYEHALRTVSCLAGVVSSKLDEING